MPEIAEAATQHYLNSLRSYNLSLATTQDSKDNWSNYCRLRNGPCTLGPQSRRRVGQSTKRDHMKRKGMGSQPS